MLAASAAGFHLGAMCCRLILLVLVAGALTAPIPLRTGPAKAGGLEPGAMPRSAAFRRAEQLTELGRRLFFEPALSASGRLACVTCHDPQHAFAAPDDQPVQPGGGNGERRGVRAVPSLTYLQAAPAFTQHFFESEDSGDESVDNGPTGGLTWDGRVDRGRDQARLPLLSPDEMANRDPAEVVGRARRAGYGDELRRLGGPGDQAGFATILAALEAFEEDGPTFYPYSSKYDATLAGTARLEPDEARGLALFEDPAKGNCARCHTSRPGRDGTPPQFTDYGFVALGAPRNPAIPANADPGYNDLGLCGPLRSDLAAHPEYCGLFRTPSLRNVALKRSFFHNGVFHSLRQVVEFYARRDSAPEKWYRRDPDGTVEKFDDLPAPYRVNVDSEPPFGARSGGRPALADDEIGDIVAFLGTLTDGYAGSGRLAGHGRGR